MHERVVEPIADHPNAAFLVCEIGALAFVWTVASLDPGHPCGDVACGMDIVMFFLLPVILQVVALVPWALDRGSLLALTSVWLAVPGSLYVVWSDATTAERVAGAGAALAGGLGLLAAAKRLTRHPIEAKLTALAVVVFLVVLLSI